MKLICPNPECAWTWNYTGKKKYPAWAACPNCLRRVKLPKTDSPDSDMEIDFLSAEDSADRIKSRLKDGWMMILGDIGTITRIEDQVYPPGTVKNRDFEMIGFPHTIFIAKKTDGLRNLLNMPIKFDDLLVMICHAGNGSKVVQTEMVYGSRDTFDDDIESAVNSATAPWNIHTRSK